MARAAARGGGIGTTFTPEGFGPSGGGGGMVHPSMMPGMASGMAQGMFPQGMSPGWANQGQAYSAGLAPPPMQPLPPQQQQQQQQQPPFYGESGQAPGYTGSSQP